MSTLIVYPSLPGTAAAAEFVYVHSDESGRTLAQGQAEAHLLPQRARATPLHLVLPALALSWHCVTLPEGLKKSLLSRRQDAARLRAALSGLLEERVLDEPDALHFAVFDHPTQSDAIWVALCQRDWLRDCVASLLRAGHVLGRISAEAVPLPLAQAPQAWITADLADGLLLFAGSDGVSALPLGPASMQWAQAQAQSQGQGALALQCEPALLTQAQPLCDEALAVQTRAERLRAAAASPWNLAQLEFSAQRSVRWLRKLSAAAAQMAWQPHWRAARWALGLLLLTQVLGLNAYAWRQRQLQDERRAALVAVLRQTFPQVTVVLDAPLQMQRAVDALAQARGLGVGPDFSQALAAVAGSEWAQGAVQSLDWADGTLRLKTEHADAAQLAQWQRTLSAAGYALQLRDGEWQLRERSAR